ncbi:MAG: YdcF family protein [Gemmatimonadaceae bacterium]
MRRRSHKSRLAAALLAVTVLAWLTCLVAVVVRARRDEARTAHAIVVLGAAQYVGRPSPVLRARLDHALALWRRGLAPRLILTGGTGVGDTTSEAAVGRSYAITHGVPDSAIYTENTGRTTRQSLRAVAAFMRAHGHNRAILVSDPFHMLRLSVLANRMGMEPLTSPTRTSPIAEYSNEEWKYLLSESFKVPFAYLFERRPAGEE